MSRTWIFAAKVLRPLHDVARLLASAALLVLVACTSVPANTGDEPKVWAVDVESKLHESFLEPTGVGKGVNVPIPDLAVRVVACDPELTERRDGSYEHTRCWRGPTGLDAADVSELTASATVNIVAEIAGDAGADHRIRQVATLDVVDVGPLAFGQAQSLGPITYEFTIDESLTPARATFYRIHVKVRDCRLSNGSVCGNNSHVYGFARPDSSRQALTARDSTPEPSPVPNSTIAARDPLISTPAKAGGLDRLGPTVTEEGDASNAASREAAERARLIRVAEQIGVRELLSAGYVGGTQNLAFGGAALPHQVVFHGGELVPQLEGQANDDSGQEILDEAFEATLGTDFGGDNSFEPSREYDAGPLGGQLRCAIMTTALPGTTMQHPICGWVDERTIGYIRGSIVVGDAVGQSPADAEAEAARLLVQMRADIETMP